MLDPCPPQILPHTDGSVALALRIRPWRHAQTDPRQGADFVYLEGLSARLVQYWKTVILKRDHYLQIVNPDSKRHKSMHEMGSGLQISIP